MISNDPKAKLSVKEAPELRTDLLKKRAFMGLNLSPTERRVYTFIESNLEDVRIMAGSKTLEFLVSWLKESIGEYKDKIINDEKTDLAQTRGIVLGQAEILAMFELILKYSKSKTEAKDNGTKTGRS